MLLSISVTVIAVVLLVAVVFQIRVALQIRKTAREAEKFLELARTQIVPLAHDVTLISREVKGILESIHRQVENVEAGVGTVKDAAVRLKGLQLRIQESIGNPLLQLAALAGAVSHGVQTFLRTLRR
ncbi:MAG: DUF948 domain-containing protein [Pseudomonadota bacterium]